MSYYPKVSGEKCFLSPICMDDASVYVKWLNDLEIARNLTLAGLMVSEESEKAALLELMKEHNYAIVTKDENRLIGNCGLMSPDHKNGTAEVGIFIGDKSLWGQGYGTEALTLLCGYAFDYLNMRNLMLRVFDFNARAVKCYEKVGFREIGRRRKAIRMEGREFDEILMDLLDEEFRSAVSEAKS
jgi:RimJ/RimL family protein N-acetyltransferase